MVVMTRFKGSFLDLLLVPIGAQQSVSRDLARSFKALDSGSKQCARVSLTGKQPVRRLGEAPHQAFPSSATGAGTHAAGGKAAGGSSIGVVVPPPDGIPLVTTPRHSLHSKLSCAVQALAVDGCRVFAGLQDGDIYVYDLTDFTCITTFQVRTPSLVCLCPATAPISLLFPLPHLSRAHGGDAASRSPTL